MPVASSTRVETRGISKRPVKAAEKAEKAIKPKLLHPISALETSAWSDALNDPSMVDYNFYSLEDPFEYPFKDQDPVWVRTQGNNWMFGRVLGRTIRVGKTRHRKEGRFYPVNFGTKCNLRKYFAPTNGEMKPDTQEIRDMLRDGGWIDSEDFSMSDGGSTYTE